MAIDWLHRFTGRTALRPTAAILLGLALAMLGLSWWIQVQLVPFNRLVLEIATGVLIVNGGLIVAFSRKDSLIGTILASATVACLGSVLIVLLMALSAGTI